LRARDFAHAQECCLTLVRMDPFRESAHRLLIATHVAEGNLAHALHHYNSFRDLLWQELRLRPSPQMEALMASKVCVAAPVSSKAATDP
jgi:DNA-binding SARP family transcriptional activator